MMTNRILITGAGGFVGEQLCRTLEDAKIDFRRVLRRRVNGRPADFMVDDINGSTDWNGALKGIDVIVHLAARVHVMNDNSADPLAAFREMNVDATLNLARQAVSNGVRRFVFVSSIKVNGEETTGIPFTAFDEPAPIDPYGQSKLEAETALKELAKVTDLEVVIVRPPLVYGPGVRANYLKLMQLIRRGVPLPLAAIHNRRSMVAIENIVDLLISCAHHPSAAGQTFLVSDDRDVSITELLGMLGAAMGKRSLLFPVPASIIAGIAALFGKSGAASRILGSLQVDIDHTKSTLGWKPVISMEEAVNKTVTYFLTHH